MTTAPAIREAGPTGQTGQTAQPTGQTGETAQPTGETGQTGQTAQPTGQTGETSETARPARAARMVVGAGRLLRTATRAVLPKRRVRLLDILRVLGLARRAVPTPVVGPKAYVQWWQRVLALLVLVAMVASIGFVLAAAVGFLVVVAGFLLEQAIA